MQHELSQTPQAMTTKHNQYTESIKYKYITLIGSNQIVVK